MRPHRSAMPYSVRFNRLRSAILRFTAPIWCLVILCTSPHADV